MGMPTNERAPEQLMENVRKFEYHAGEIFKWLGSTAPEEQRELIRMIETALKQIWSRLVGDNDLTNKREVYAQVSAFLCKHFPMPLQVCMHVCLQLCEETDEALLEGVKLNQYELAQATELLTKAKELNLFLTVCLDAPALRQPRPTTLLFGLATSVIH